MWFIISRDLTALTILVTKHEGIKILEKFKNSLIITLKLILVLGFKRVDFIDLAQDLDEWGGLFFNTAYIFRSVKRGHLFHDY